MSDNEQIRAGGASPILVNWEGSLLVHHSLAMVNRELLLHLLRDSRFSVRHIPYEPDQFTIDSDARLAELRRLSGGPHGAAQVHVRHRWPPDFSRPNSGRYVLIQPWEYGALYKHWVEEIERVVDEVWVPSHFVKWCYVRSGVPERKVVVVPNGIDPAIFSPGSEPAPWVREYAGERFCFLYNGGVTTRKGADLLVGAYLAEFGADEPVCLVIKDSQVYATGLAAKIHDAAAQPRSPRILYTSRALQPAELPGLYTACDCYVQPYRGEGYGLPLAEAAACGLPVIATGGGACIDFLDEGDAFFADFTMETFPRAEIDSQPTAGNPFYLVPDMAHVRRLMRYVLEHRDEARARGRRLSEKVRTHHTWERAARIAAERLYSLAGQEPGLVETGIVGDTGRDQLDEAIELYKQGMHADAARVFRRCLLHSSRRSAAYEGLGLVAYAQGRFHDSFDLLRRASAISPGVPGIVLNWAEAARKLGRLAELHGAVGQALARAPDSEELGALQREIAEMRTGD